jgi:hypothetical protein
MRVGDRKRGLPTDFGFFRDCADRGVVCEGLSTAGLVRFIYPSYLAFLEGHITNTAYPGMNVLSDL